MLKLPEVSVRYGAPMGRRSASCLDTTSPVVIWPIALDSDGCDSGGAYWGVSEVPLYAAVDGEGDMQFVRADSRHAAARRLGLDARDWRTPTPEEAIEDFDYDAMVTRYLETALWSTCDEDGNSLSDRYAEHHFSAEFLAETRRDCEAFVAGNAADLVASDLDASSIGQHFWLARGGYGSGFWDLAMGAVGSRLADAARAYGEVDLVPGDQLPSWEEEPDV